MAAPAAAARTILARVMSMMTFLRWPEVAGRSNRRSSPEQ
jgi:hypothetical protein